MPTLALDPRHVTPEGLAPAVEWLARGGIVALPTETFYGLAADPRSDLAVASLFDLKGRPPGLALPLVAASRGQVEATCGPLPDGARRLAERFWPGPLSLVLDLAVPLATRVAGADGTVAIRVPDHDVPRLLAAVWGGPLTATSANRSGEAPVRRAASLGDLAADARLLVIDAGDTPGGAPSTIVDARAWPPRLVREGAVPWSRVLESDDR